MQITDLFVQDHFKMAIQYLLNRKWRRVKKLQYWFISSNLLLKHYAYFPMDIMINSKTRY